MTTEIAVKAEVFSFAPKNLTEALQLADIMAASDLVPKDYKGKSGNILVAIQMGQELGLQPLQSLQNIAVINGRPCVWGDALLALVMGHKDFVNIEESIKDNTAYCIVYRKGRTPVEKKFSIDDARKAKLWDREGPWKTYPERMLQMRARGFALRDAFADVLRGVITAEEASDTPSEKNMGAAVLVEASSEKAQRLKERLGIKLPVNESIDLNTGEIMDNSSLIADITQQINSATSLDILETIRVKIAGSNLSDAEKNPLREAFISKNKELKLKTVPEQDEEQSAESKEFFGEDQ